ncbi:hypothetical protein E2320_006985, partial [Naja naja]
RSRFSICPSVIRSSSAFSDPKTLFNFKLRNGIRETPHVHLLFLLSRLAKDIRKKVHYFILNAKGRIRLVCKKGDDLVSQNNFFGKININTCVARLGFKKSHRKSSSCVFNVV